jgi:hypothetical protein
MSLADTCDSNVCVRAETACSASLVRVAVISSALIIMVLLCTHVVCSPAFNSIYLPSFQSHATTSGRNDACCVVPQ